jgi:dTDP-D-glucose 4,6-dehydratase
MVDFHSSRPGHDLRYALDGTRLHEMGWSIPVSFEESLQRTVRWIIDPTHRRWLDL